MNKKLKKFATKHSSNIANYLLYVLIVLIFVGIIFIGLVLNSVFVITVAGHEYNLHRAVTDLTAITEVQHVTIQCFAPICLVFLIGISVWILAFVHRHSNLKKKKFWPNIIEFSMTIAFCIVELFSIIYGFIGSTVTSASIGLILIVVIVVLSIIIFSFMIWGHLHSIIHNSYYLNKSKDVNKMRIQKMLSILNKQNSQLKSLNQENLSLKSVINKLNNDNEN